MYSLVIRPLSYNVIPVASEQIFLIVRHCCSSFKQL